MAERPPLEGIRVVEFTHHRAGPTCGMILGDMGADVIKVEAPWGGDVQRTQGREIRDGIRVDFLTCNRNKRSVTLNLKTEEGLQAAKRLVQTADVVVENYRPGALERLGLGYEALSALNPRLIYCSISGWGSKGPYAGQVGLDQIAQGYSGFMTFNGTEETGPLRVGVPIGDLTTGIYAALGVVAALYERERSGKGQKIECSLLESLVSLLSFHGLNYLFFGILPQRVGNNHPIMAPMGAYEAQDGLVNVAPASQEHFERLCQILGLEDMITDPRFKDLSSRLENRAVLEQRINERMRTRPRMEWVRLLLDAGIPAGPVNEMNEVFESEQVRANEMVLEVDHPVLGRIPQLGFPIKFGRTPCQIRLAPPMLGQHTEEVLAELGMTPGEAAGGDGKTP